MPAGDGVRSSPAAGAHTQAQGRAPCEDGRTAPSQHPCGPLESGASAGPGAVAAKSRQGSGPAVPGTGTATPVGRSVAARFLGGVPPSPRTPCVALTHGAGVCRTSASMGTAAAAVLAAGVLPAGSDTATGLNAPWVQAVKRAPRRKRLSAPEAGGGGDAGWGCRFPGLKENPPCADGQKRVLPRAILGASKDARLFPK